MKTIITYIQKINNHRRLMFVFRSVVSFICSKMYNKEVPLSSNQAILKKQEPWDMFNLNRKSIFYYAVITPNLPIIRIWIAYRQRVVEHKCNYYRVINCHLF